MSEMDLFTPPPSWEDMFEGDDAPLNWPDLFPTQPSIPDVAYPELVDYGDIGQAKTPDPIAAPGPNLELETAKAAFTTQEADVLDTTDIFGAGIVDSKVSADVAPAIENIVTPREVQPEETVQGQLIDLFSQDNPLMEIARQRQLKLENRRGMLNTASGQQRGELSAMLVGLQIAGKDALTYARAAELNQSYEEAAALVEQSFQHNWALNNQLATHASRLSYQDFQEGIAASIQTFKEQSALLVQQLANTLVLSEKDQQELLELTSIQHENTVAQIKAQGVIQQQNTLQRIQSELAAETALAQVAQELNIGLAEAQTKLNIARDAATSLQRINEQGAQLQRDLDLLEARTADAKEILDKQKEIEETLIEKRGVEQIVVDNNQLTNRLEEITAQATAAATLQVESGTRTLQANYLLESGAMLRQTVQEVATINTTEGLTLNQQRRAINQVREQLQSNLDFLQELYSNSPYWDPDFAEDIIPPDLFATPDEETTEETDAAPPVDPRVPGPGPTETPVWPEFPGPTEEPGWPGRPGPTNRPPDTRVPLRPPGD